MNADRKKRIAHEISNWKNACNCRAVQLTGDRMAALLQELVDAPEPDGWLPGGFRIEHFAKDDLSLTDEANAERRFFVKRIEPPYHKDGVWFGATAGEALAKACAALGIEYAAPPAPKLSDERILEIYEEAKANWNAQADQCNQWSDLGVDEVVTLVARAIEREILGGAQA